MQKPAALQWPAVGLQLGMGTYLCAAAQCRMVARTGSAEGSHPAQLLDSCSSQGAGSATAMSHCLLCPSASRKGAHALAPVAEGTTTSACRRRSAMCQPGTGCAPCAWQRRRTPSGRARSTPWRSFGWWQTSSSMTTLAARSAQSRWLAADVLGCPLWLPTNHGSLPLQCALAPGVPSIKTKAFVWRVRLSDR